MTSWVTVAAQWRAWVEEDSVTATPLRSLDDFDEEVRVRLAAARFGDHGETLAPISDVVGSDDSMRTLVRPLPERPIGDGSVADGVDEEDAASTLVHAPRLADVDSQASDDGVEVQLRSPDGRLSVTLEPTTSSDESWFIPTLTGPPAAGRDPSAPRAEVSASEDWPAPIQAPGPAPIPAPVPAPSPAPARTPSHTLVVPPDIAGLAAPLAASPPSTSVAAARSPTFFPPPIPGATIGAAPAPAVEAPAPSSTPAPPPPDPSATVVAPPPSPPAAVEEPTGSTALPDGLASPELGDRYRASARTGNTLIPIDPDASSSQTSGVITLIDEEEPPPPPRRSSKIVIGEGEASTAAQDDSGEFLRPRLEPSVITELPDAELDADVLDSTELVDVEAPGTPDERPPPAPKPAPRPEGPPPPPRAGEITRLTGDTSISEPENRSSPDGGAALTADASRAGRTSPPAPERHWSQGVFGDHYGALMPAGSHAIVRAEAEFVRELAKLRVGSELCDIGCGEGGHARAWADAGIRVVGLDASPAMIRRATELTGAPLPNPRWVLGDVCTRPIAAKFDAVVCIGTSFGYDDDESNAEMLAAIAAMVRSDGRLVLQVLNRDYMAPRLPTRSWWQGNGCLVLDEADMDDWHSRLRVRRTIVFEDGRQFEHPISIRAYALHELCVLLAAAGLRVLEVSGSRFTRGRFYGATSPDIWLVAQPRG